MDVREKSRHEIEIRMQGMGEYVQMDYLNSCLGKQLDFDTRKFVMIRLAKMYEGKHMFTDSAKLFRAAAEINTTFRGKIDDFLKAGELFIKAGVYEEAELCFNRASAAGNTAEKIEIKHLKKEYYKMQARAFLDAGKRMHAATVYEKLLDFNIGDDEKREIKNNLLEIYLKLGKVREYGVLKKSED